MIKIAQNMGRETSEHNIVRYIFQALEQQYIHKKNKVL